MALAGRRRDASCRDVVELALHDLTGFEGRCDAIVFSADDSFTPPNGDPEMAAFASRRCGLPAKPEDAGPFDLVVVGGGIAGTARPSPAPGSG